MKKKSGIVHRKNVFQKKKLVHKIKFMIQILILANQKKRKKMELLEFAHLKILIMILNHYLARNAQLIFHFMMKNWKNAQKKKKAKIKIIIRFQAQTKIKFQVKTKIKKRKSPFLAHRMLQYMMLK